METGINNKCKAFTSLEQSRKLAEILPLESADMYYLNGDAGKISIGEWENNVHDEDDIPCWSLAALLNILSEIKPQVYTPILFPSEGKWILQFAEHGHGNVCEVSCDNPVDACYEMILKLNELNLL